MARAASATAKAVRELEYHLTTTLTAASLFLTAKGRRGNGDRPPSYCDFGSADRDHAKARPTSQGRRQHRRYRSGDSICVGCVDSENGPAGRLGCGRIV